MDYTSICYLISHTPKEIYNIAVCFRCADVINTTAAKKSMLVEKNEPRNNHLQPKTH